MISIDAIDDLSNTMKPGTLSLPGEQPLDSPMKVQEDIDLKIKDKKRDILERINDPNYRFNLKNISNIQDMINEEKSNNQIEREDAQFN